MVCAGRASSFVHVERGQWGQIPCTRGAGSVSPSQSLEQILDGDGLWGPGSAAQVPSQPSSSLLKDWAWSLLLRGCCFAGRFSFPRKDSKLRRKCDY